MAKQSRTSILDVTSENIHSVLLRLARRLRALNKERDSIAASLHRVAAAGSAMLVELGTSAADVAGMAPRVFVRKGGRPKGYVMSAATKAKLRAAWKRRKAAAAGRGEGAKRTLSAEARAKIAAAQRARWAKAKSA